MKYNPNESTNIEKDEGYVNLICLFTITQGVMVHIGLAHRSYRYEIFDVESMTHKSKLCASYSDSLSCQTMVMSVVYTDHFLR